MMWNAYALFAGAPAALARRMTEPVRAALVAAGCPEAAPIAPNLWLFAAPSLPVFHLPGGGAALIGTAYGVGGRAQLRSADPQAFAGDVATGTAIVDRHWGSYVAIATGRDDRLHIVRSPSVALPCYVVMVDDILVVTSDCRLLAVSGLPPPEVDPHRLAGCLRAPNLRTANTALGGVDELLPGYRLSGSPRDWHQQPCWSPWPHAAQAAGFADPVDAQRALRATIVDSVATELGGGGPRLLSLSGGLDSAIVACAMTEAGIGFAAVNFATRQRTGDERIYARALADHLGFPLVEAEERIDLIDLETSSAAHLPRPCARAFAQSADKQQRGLVADGDLAGATFVHGGGGDSIFAYLRSARPVADAWLDRGLAQAWRTARDLSAITETSLWETLRGGTRFVAQGRRRYRWPIDTGLLAADIRSLPAGVRHDWLEPPADMHPGKVLQVAFTLGIQNRLEGYLRERDGPNIAPLLAQPVVETCLRIPTWMWCRGGINRAVVRAAFADRLPDAILRRTTKGTPGSLLFELVDARRPQIRAMVLEGRLAGAGLVDRPAVEAVLKRPLLDPMTCNRLMALVDAEAWMASWQRHRS